LWSKSAQIEHLCLKVNESHRKPQRSPNQKIQVIMEQSPKKHTGGNSKASALRTRTAAHHVVRNVLAGDVLDVMLAKEARRDHDPRDMAFLKQLTMLYFKHLGSVRRVMRKMIERPIPTKAYKVQQIIELGLVQVLYMRTDDHAAVDQTVEMVAKLKHPQEVAMKGMANAVLRRVIREKEETLAFIARDQATDLAPWIKFRWAEQFGGKVVDAIGASLAGAVPIDLTPKNPDEAKAIAKAVDGFVMPTGSVRLKEATDITKLEGFEDGNWWVQDMAAAIPATLFGNIEGKVVVDFCAAPGGKTMQLAAQGASVVAVDRSLQRLERLRENVARTQFKDKVSVLVADATNWVPQMEIDHILLDAPCSATGTLRRNPDVQWSKGLPEVNKLVKLQAEILDHAFTLLPVGGMLIYCVCSLEDEEGATQIEDFLAKTPKAKLVPIRSRNVGGLNKLATKEGYLQCRPDHLANKGGMDGFFAARIERIG